MFDMLPLGISRSSTMWKYHRDGSYTSPLALLFYTVSLSSNLFCKICAYCWFSLLPYPLLQYDPLTEFFQQASNMQIFSIVCLNTVCFLRRTNKAEIYTTRWIRRWIHEAKISCQPSRQWTEETNRLCSLIDVVTTWLVYPPSPNCFAACLNCLHSQASGHINIPWNCCAVNFHLFVFHKFVICCFVR
jgi:hypothetical protein